MRARIIIPLFNESKRIDKTQAALREYILNSKHRIGVLFVDDGSTDGTSERLEFTCIRYERNRGKGYAIRTGVLYDPEFTGIIFLMDADLSVDLAEVERVLDYLIPARTLLYGSRKSSSRNFIRLLASRVFYLVRKAFFWKLPVDTQCPFKAAHSNDMRLWVKDMKTDRFCYDVELFLAAKHWKKWPVTYSDKPGSTVSVIKTGMEMFHDLLVIRFGQNSIIYKLLTWKYFHFVIVGAIGTIIGAMVLYSLTEWLGLWYMFSYIIAALCGSINNYLLNKHFVFKQNK